MTKKNFYAVRIGVKPGIYRTWPECQKQVDGFKGAKFRGFVTEKEAIEFIGSPAKQGKKAPKLDTGLVMTGVRWWLEPEYDKRINGCWNPKYD